MAKQPPPVSIRLTPDLLRRFDVYCAAHRRKRGEMLRMLVEDAVAAQDARTVPAATAATGTDG